MSPLACLFLARPFFLVPTTSKRTTSKRWVRVWVLDFLSDRKQRVKLSSDCLSEWGLVPAGVPQGTKLGPGYSY